ncbi:hypothetical protein HLVA_20410 [Haliovirga abyssi]|uniref:ABC transmembrane type-2 domain-containing protein n=2 Tax=Haliovirga abyssi TaxID=2996794 RepID=A0AAU9DIP7_9FUSO|nr:hypothetical protein HLVA_20410 [Haliovirga abyssi]
MLQMPLLFFSNVLYATEKLPLIFGIIVKINPMTYLVAGLRTMFTQQGSFVFTRDLTIQILILFIFAIFGMSIATKAYKEIISRD